MARWQPRSPSPCPGHSPVPAPSPPPRGTVTYLAGTVCSQGTRDTGRSGPRCPVPARWRALGDRESGRVLFALPARGAQRVPPTAPTALGTRAGRQGSLPRGAARLPGVPQWDAPGAGDPRPRPHPAWVSALAGAHPLHLEPLRIRASPAPWPCGKDSGLGLGTSGVRWRLLPSGPPGPPTSRFSEEAQAVFCCPRPHLFLFSRDLTHRVLWAWRSRWRGPGPRAFIYFARESVCE